MFNNLVGIFYYVIFLSYSWSILVFLYELPSFLLHLSISEIIGFSSYQVMFSLIESLLYTGILAIILYILPIKGLRDNLLTAGALIALSSALSSIILIEFNSIVAWVETRIPGFDDGVSFRIVLAIWLSALLGLPLMSIITARHGKFTALIRNFLDNLSLLSKFYISLGVTGTLIVIIRNLL